MKLSDVLLSENQDITKNEIVVVLEDALNQYKKCTDLTIFGVTLKETTKLKKEQFTTRYGLCYFLKHFYYFETNSIQKKNNILEELYHDAKIISTFCKKNNNMWKKENFWWFEEGNIKPRIKLLKMTIKRLNGKIGT